MSFRTSTTRFASTSLPSPTGYRPPVIACLARTISQRVFLPLLPLRSSRCRSSAGAREMAEPRRHGGLRSSSPFHCKHFSTQRPPSQTCGWFCSSRLLIGLVLNCCAIRSRRLQIKHQTSNIGHFFGGGYFTFRWRSHSLPKVPSGGRRC